VAKRPSLSEGIAHNVIQCLYDSVRRDAPSRGTTRSMPDLNGLERCVVAAIETRGLLHERGVSTKTRLRFAGQTSSEAERVDFAVFKSRDDSHPSLSLLIDLVDGSVLPAARRMAVLTSESGNGMWLCAARRLDAQALASVSKEILAFLERTPLGIKGEIRTLCLAFVSLEDEKAWVGELGLGRSRSSAGARNLLVKGVGWHSVKRGCDAELIEGSAFSVVEFRDWYEVESSALVFSDELLAHCPKFKRRTFLLVSRAGDGFKLRCFGDGEPVVVTRVGEIATWEGLWRRFPVEVEHPTYSDANTPLRNREYWENRIDQLNRRLSELGLNPAPAPSVELLPEPAELSRPFVDAAAEAGSHFFSVGLRTVIPIAIGSPPRLHSFDLASEDLSVVGECRNITWTESGVAPIGELSQVSEAVLCLSGAGKAQTRFIVLRRSVCGPSGESLAEFYMRTHGHLLGPVRLLELDVDSGRLVEIHRSQIE